MATEKTYNAVDSKQQLLLIEIKTGRYGGYKQELLADILTELQIDFYLCTKCNGLMRDACQIGEEQDLACEGCVGEGEKPVPIIKPRKKILELRAKCPLADRGCVWKGTVGEIEIHLDECPEFIVNCLNRCDVILKRSKLLNHCENECLNRKINCMHCKAEMEFKEREFHLTRCPELPLSCPNKCLNDFPRKNINSHIEYHCLNTMVQCTNGCKMKMKRSKLLNHSENECLNRKINCMHCKAEMQFKEREFHLTRCPELPLFCPNKCLKEFPRKNIDSHIEDDCPNTMVQCRIECGLQMKRSKLSDHEMKECPHRKVSCKHCIDSMQHRELQIHYNICKEFPLFCPNECLRKLIRKTLESHIENDCPNTLIACPYKEMGCDVLSKRCELEEHKKTFESEHLDITESHYSTKVKKMEVEMENKDKECKRLKREMESLKLKIKEMETRLTDEVISDREENIQKHSVSDLETELPQNPQSKTNKVFLFSLSFSTMVLNFQSVNLSPMQGHNQTDMADSVSIEPLLINLIQKDNLYVLTGFNQTISNLAPTVLLQHLFSQLCL